MCGFIGVVGCKITISNDKFSSALNHIYYRGQNQSSINKSNFWMLGFI